MGASEWTVTQRVLSMACDAVKVAELWAWRRGHRRTETALRETWLWLLCRDAWWAGEDRDGSQGDGLDPFDFDDTTGGAP